MPTEPVLTFSPRPRAPRGSPRPAPPGASRPGRCAVPGRITRRAPGIFSASSSQMANCSESLELAPDDRDRHRQLAASRPPPSTPLAPALVGRAVRVDAAGHVERELALGAADAAAPLGPVEPEPGLELEDGLDVVLARRVPLGLQRLLGGGLRRLLPAGDVAAHAGTDQHQAREPLRRLERRVDGQRAAPSSCRSATPARHPRPRRARRAGRRGGGSPPAPAASRPNPRRS